MGKIKESPSKFVRGGEDKSAQAVLVSGITVMRRANPQNVQTAYAQTNMAVDYSTLQAKVPNFKNADKYVNRSGKASHCIVGKSVGSGSNDKGKF